MPEQREGRLADMAILPFAHKRHRLPSLRAHNLLNCWRREGCHMARNEFIKGTAVFVLVFIVGFLSNNSVDQYFAVEAGQKSACIRNGSWHNWSWSNVPMLSPRCSENT
jgi:hypothetical protein